MIGKTASVVINQKEDAALGQYALDFITSEKKESPFLDFKLTISTNKESSFPEIAKDIFAFSNYGGGWILIGWNEHSPSQYVPVGVDNSYKIDQATLQEKFNSYVDEPITLEYTEFERDFKPLFARTKKEEVRNMVNSVSYRFGIIFVPPSRKVLVPKKEGKYSIEGKEKTVFKPGEIFYRRGTQSIKGPSAYESELMNNRLKKENYRLSVLSGEPDEIEETIYSNLFPVTRLPEQIYVADKKDLDDVSIKNILKENKIFPEWFYKFKVWSDKIVTFENLFKESSPYRKLVNISTIKKTETKSWLTIPDKKNIVVELLNREFKHFSIGRGLYYFDKRNSLYFSTHEESRSEKWKGRYVSSERRVAARMFASSIDQFIYWHVAFEPMFILIGDTFYLRILPTFIITSNGKSPISNFMTGPIITKLSYNKYNSDYLNTILFWINKLGDGNPIQINDYITIAEVPLELKSQLGIQFDLPTNEFREEEPEDNDGEEESYEF